MNELAEYLDNIGHALGLGGIEGFIGAPIVIMAFLVIVIQVLRRVTQSKEFPIFGERFRDNHLKCSDEEFEEMITDPTYKSLHCNIWHKKDQ